jgi:hypothetical protein
VVHRPEVNVIAYLALPASVVRATPGLGPEDADVRELNGAGTDCLVSPRTSAALHALALVSAYEQGEQIWQHAVGAVLTGLTQTFPRPAWARMAIVTAVASVYNAYLATPNLQAYALQADRKSASGYGLIMVNQGWAAPTGGGAWEAAVAVFGPDVGGWASGGNTSPIGILPLRIPVLPAYGVRLTYTQGQLGAAVTGGLRVSWVA